MTAQPTTALAFIVADTYVRQDEQGRYCLNDLHKAAGGEQRHRPNYWLENQQTQDLVSTLAAEGRRTSGRGSQVSGLTAGIPAVSGSEEPLPANSADSQSFRPPSQTGGIPPVSTTEGRSGGTWVSIELVYAYAMWISPEFHLRVIRTYHSLLTSKQPPRQDLVQARHDRQARFAFQLVTAIDRAKTPFARAALLQQLHQVNQDLGVPTPEADQLPAFPDPDAKDKATVAAFWEAYNLMVSKGAKLNHAKDSTLIAINLAQFLTEAAARKITVPTRASLQKALPQSTSPAFDSNKAVNSALQDRAVHCWVFQAPPAVPDSAQPGLFAGEAA